MAATGKAKNWKDLVAENVFIPVPWDRQQDASDTNTAFCIAIRTIEGLTPKDDNKHSGNLEYQLQVSLFDVTYKQFFGRTWVGPPVHAKTIGQKSRLNYNQNVYFHSSLNDASIVAVVEIVAVTHTEDGKKQQVGCGWGFFHIFKVEGDMLDTTSATPSPTQRMDVYHGSPRSLLFLDEPIEENENLTLINSCQMLFTVQTHRPLQKALHLIPENILVGSNDLIPGLAEGQRDPKHPHAAPDALKRPRLLKTMSSYIEKVSLTLTPSIEKLEEELCQHLNEDRINRENKVADGTTISVIERRLQVGVHNGWTYVDKPEVIQLTPDTSQKGGGTHRGWGSLRGHQRTGSTGSIINTANALVHKNRVQLDGMAEDPMFSIVFVLEYVVGEPKAGRDRKAALAKSSTFNIVLRWAAWNPLSDLHNPEQTLHLIGGPSSVPDSLFVFRQSGETIGSSSSLQNMLSGSLSFTFGHQKKMHDASPAEKMQIPHLNLPPDSARAPSQLSVGTDDSSGALQEVRIMGRPPIPARPGMSMHDFYHQTAPGGMYAGTHAFAQPYGYAPPYSTTPMPGLSPAMAMQQSARGYIPVEIQHIRDPPSPQASARMGMMTPDLHELPFTPVHAPIMATIPGKHSGQGLSRAAYAKLYTAGFPPILDRKGEPPEVLDPADSTHFILAKEESDKLQANEIILQFLAYARFLSFEQGSTGKRPATVFFTFQFYRFPQVTTERLLLGNVEGELSADPNSLPCLLQKLDKDGSVIKGPPGYQVKYHVDPAYLKPGEGRLFVEHLSQQTLHIDVWDADSLLLIGSCAVDLKHLCRQGQEAVQVTYELDVLSTEYVENEGAVPAGDVMQAGAVKPLEMHSILKGRLHLRMANIGHPADPKLSKSDRMPVPSKPKLIITPDNSGVSQFVGGSLSSVTSHTSALKKNVCKAMHMSEASHELASVLSVNKDKSGSEQHGESNEARRRKLARLQALRQQEGNKPQILSPFKQEKEERARDLKSIEIYRNQAKREGIMNMLNQAITTEHTLHPSLGTTEFFEFVLRNPYNLQHTVIIECDDPELRVITDTREWRHFKMLNEVYTSVEEGMFNTSNESGKPELFLRPKESVNVPFKFLSFKADHRVHPQAPTDPFRPEQKKYSPNRKVDPMETRLVKVYFKTKENKPIAILALRVEPQPHIIDQTFRFHHPEQAFLKKSIRLPPLQSLPGVPVGGPAVNQVFAKCSDPNVICDSRIVQQGEPHDVFLKVACGASPQIKRFFVAVYADPFLSRPIQIWQFYVHALQRVDVSCIEGQTSRLTLLLRGTQAARLVQCFSSHPNEMQMEPKDPFMLAANTLQEIHVGVRPGQSGCKFIYLNVVDIEYHQLVRNWLLCVTSRTPVISKAYELALPIGGGKGSNKRIAYTNPYPYKKVFHLRSNREDLLQFKDTRLEIPPSETVNMGLRFAPSQTPGTVEILVFINDEDDKNEETFCVRASYQ